MIWLSDACRLWHAFHHVSLLTGVGQTSHYRAWVLLDEVGGVHVELLDHIAALPGEYFCSHDILPMHVIVAQLLRGIHYAAQVVLLVHLEDDDLGIDRRHLDVELADLSDLSH